MAVTVYSRLARASAGIQTTCVLQSLIVTAVVDIITAEAAVGLPTDQVQPVTPVVNTDVWTCYKQVLARCGASCGNRAVQWFLLAEFSVPSTITSMQVPDCVTEQHLSAAPHLHPHPSGDDCPRYTALWEVGDAV